jgi:hypothetical protein
VLLKRQRPQNVRCRGDLCAMASNQVLTPPPPYFLVNAAA